MAERTVAPRTHIIVCIALILLTIVTVGVSFTQLPSVWHTVIGMVIAVCKASLVVLFFMHVLVSPKLTRAVIAVACFWLMILFVLTMNDYFSRGLVPYTPGH